MVLELGLAGVAASVLTEGIKFLYGQAADLLKRGRERRSDHQSGELETPEPAHMDPLPEGIFEGILRLDRFDETVASLVEGDLSQLLERPELVRIGALGIEADPADAELFESAEALRSLLEHVYRQRITFIGEVGRLPSGPWVVGEAEAETVEGLLAGVRARRIVGGTVYGKSKARYVEGEATGVDADFIG